MTQKSPILTQPLRRELERRLQDVCSDLITVRLAGPKNNIELARHMVLSKTYSSHSHYSIDEIHRIWTCAQLLPETKLVRPLVQLYTERPSPAESIDPTVLCRMNSVFKKDPNLFGIVYAHLDPFFREHEIKWTPDYISLK